MNDPKNNFFLYRLRMLTHAHLVPDGMAQIWDVPYPQTERHKGSCNA